MTAMFVEQYFEKPGGLLNTAKVNPHPPPAVSCLRLQVWKHVFWKYSSKNNRKNIYDPSWKYPYLKNLILLQVWACIAVCYMAASFTKKIDMI